MYADVLLRNYSLAYSHSIIVVVSTTVCCGSYIINMLKICVLLGANV